DDCGVGFGVLLLQFREEFCERALAIAQLQNSLSRALNPDCAFRKQHNRRCFGAAPTASGGESGLAQIQKPGHDHSSILNAPAGGHPGCTYAKYKTSSCAQRISHLSRSAWTAPSCSSRDLACS